MNARRLFTVLALTALVVGACSSGDDASSAPEPAKAEPRAKQNKTAKRRTIATGLHVPWGIAFLPNHDALVSERTTGRILRISHKGGKPKVAMKVPGVDVDAGEGGLLGIAVSPSYRKDKLVYAYFTSGSDNRIVRFKLGGKVHKVLTGIKRGFIHNGGRIAFGPDHKLYAGVGETGDRPLAQDRGSLNGKILRMNPNGSVPKGNPFKGSLVWSYGHRNVQGLAWDKKRRLWEAELGQDTFDEVNLIRKGHNYGWPNVEGKGSTQGGKYTNPKVTWPTSEASPSGDAIRRGYLYVAALRGERLWRIKLNGTRTGKPKALLNGTYGRIRTVVRTPSGHLWIATSNRDGRGEVHKGDDRIVQLR